MENYQFAYQSGIWIDACPDQHGIWLDAGELSLIREYQENTRNRGALSRSEMHRAATAMLDGAVQAKSAYAKICREQNEERERRQRYEGMLE
jgi:Zn-finger nucleic acid-binding protein